MITYDYYRIFYYVAQYKSFTKAAAALGNNQPNITRCMNNLEAELDCKLFLRSNKGVLLTPEGHKLYEHVAIAFEQLALGEEAIIRNRDLENGLISIGASENAPDTAFRTGTFLRPLSACAYPSFKLFRTAGSKSTGK